MVDASVAMKLRRCARGGSGAWKAAACAKRGFTRYRQTLKQSKMEVCRVRYIRSRNSLFNLVRSGFLPGSDHSEDQLEKVETLMMEGANSHFIMLL